MVDVTAKEEVPQIVPHSTNANVTKKGSAWVFRTSVSERFYAAIHAKYLSERVGKKVAYLYTTDGAAIGFAKDYMAFMRRTYQTEPLYEAQMQETDLDFRSHLLKIKSLNPGGVWRSAVSSTPSPASRSRHWRSVSRHAFDEWRRPRLRMRRCRSLPAMRWSVSRLPLPFHARTSARWLSNL